MKKVLFLLSSVKFFGLLIYLEELKRNCKLFLHIVQNTNVTFDQVFYFLNIQFQHIFVELFLRFVLIICSQQIFPVTPW